MATGPEILETLALERRLERDDDLRALMSTHGGRRLVRWIVFGLGRLHVSNFDPAVKDGICAALHQARHAGRQDVAIELLADLERVAPEELLSMKIEDHREAQAERARMMDASAGDRP